MTNRGLLRRGLGYADPKKTRAERSVELKALLLLPCGRDVVAYYYLKYSGGLPGTTIPTGAVVIQAILDHEYPNEST
jgi:hypothetical protein